MPRARYCASNRASSAGDGGRGCQEARLRQVQAAGRVHAPRTREVIRISETDVATLVISEIQVVGAEAVLNPVGHADQRGPWMFTPMLGCRCGPMIGPLARRVTRMFMWLLLVADRWHDEAQQQAARYDRMAMRILWPNLPAELHQIARDAIGSGFETDFCASAAEVSDEQWANADAIVGPARRNTSTSCASAGSS
jgi:hypothetical protein